MDYAKLVNIIRLRFLNEETWYSIQDKSGEYSVQKDEYGKPLNLDNKLLEKHLRGEITLAVQPINPLNQEVKFAGIDLDAAAEPKRDSLESLIPAIHKLRQEGLKYGLSFSVAFSGRRGWHLYTFPERTVPAEVMRKALFTLSKECNVSVKEVFPYGDHVSAVLKEDDKYETYLPQGIKLVGGKHQKGTWSGFVDPHHLEWEENFPNLLDLESSLESLPYSSLSGIYKLAYLHPQNEKKNKQAGTIDWSLLESEHPNCIGYMLTAGVPSSMEYNKANMTIARYCISRKLSFTDSLALAGSIANLSKHHESSKKTVQEKLKNFRSVHGSMVKNPVQARWQCSYIWSNLELRKQCLTCPISAKAAEIGQHQHLEINQADELAEEEVIRYILEFPDALNEAFDMFVMADCFLTTVVKDNCAIPVAELTVLAMEACREEELRISTILSNVEEQFIDVVAEYLQKVMDLKPCNKDTFWKHLKRIQDNGNRIAAIAMVYESASLFLDRSSSFEVGLDTLTLKAERMVSKHSRGSIKPMSSRLVGLVEDLLDESPRCIPTMSLWLNELLLGGWQAKKAYAIGAPPGAGKTTFLNTCGDYAAKEGFPVCQIQYEMDEPLLWYYSLSRSSKINSRLIEGRKWLDEKYENGGELKKKLAEAIRYHAQEIAPRTYIKEADETVFPSTIKSYIRQIRIDQGLPDNFPVLVLVDSIQHVNTGVQSLDESTNETLRVSRVASALKRVARSENAAIIYISEITKEAFKKAQDKSTGRFDMGAMRDSFKIAHSADGVGFLVAGKYPVKIEDTKETQLWDQIDMIADRFKEPLKTQLLDLKKNNSLDYSVKARYAMLEWVKLRGSLLGTPLFIYEKAVHNFIPIDIDKDLLEALTSDE